MAPRAAATRRGRGGRIAASLLILFLGAATARADGDAPARASATPPPKSAAGRPADLEALIKGLQGRYDRLQDFKAAFEQRSLLEAAGSAQVARGEVYFRKPGMMRWNYETPEPQQIVIRDGKLWQYVPADKQIVVQALDTSRVEYAFLTGLGELESQFDIRWAEPRRRPDDPLEYIELTPRKDGSSFDRVVLGVDPKGFRILATEVTDFLGNVTSLRFKDLRDNVSLAPDLFTMARPKGVDLIDMTGGGTGP